MDQLPFRASDSDRPPNAPSRQGPSFDPGRFAVTSTDEPMLLAIDRVIRSLSVTPPLRLMLAAEPALSACQGICGHHPDSADVLFWCRRRHPDWTEFPRQTVSVVCQRLLHDRWVLAVLRRIAEEPLPTIRRVLSAIARLAPHGCDDDAWWVWRQLAIYEPENAGYRYSRRQIRRAWRAVASLRARWDCAGGAPGHRTVARSRQKATARLSAELCLGKDVLDTLDIDDYSALDGTLVPHDSPPLRAFQLSADARDGMDRWLELRGLRAGHLFDCPSVGKRMSLYAPFRILDEEILMSKAGDGSRATDSEDFVEQLCVDLGETAHAFIIETMVDDGDWSMAFVNKLIARCPSFAGNGPLNCRLSRRERWRARAEIKLRAATMGVAEQTVLGGSTR